MTRTTRHKGCGPRSQSGCPATPAPPTSPRSVAIRGENGLIEVWKTGSPSCKWRQRGGRNASQNWRLSSRRPGEAVRQMPTGGPPRADVYPVREVSRRDV